MDACGRALLPAALAALLGAGGCQSMTRTYEGHTRDQVWQAMVAAAKDPRYRDWIVTDSGTWVNEPEARVEMFRELKRDVVLPGQKPYREEVEWRFRSFLEPGEPPTVKFATTDLAIPAHFWLQADHYFDEVQAQMAAVPLMPPPKSHADDSMIMPPPVAGPSTAKKDDILDAVPSAPTPAAARGVATPSQPIDVPDKPPRSPNKSSKPIDTP